ncbi:MAG: heme-copper oxidase subunit III [Bacteroidota bacterium]|nr:heme-copper oxidase subunit III [Bacteroidota bacterium]
MNSGIPYSVETRPDTGLHNAKLGVWLFLASEVMLFGALFSSYALLRVGAEAWPRGADILNVPLGAVNTIILIASSITMVRSWTSLLRNDFKNFRLLLSATEVLGIIFLVLKFTEYKIKFEHGLFPSSSTFLAMYFTLTGIHALHLFGGIVVNAYHLVSGKRLWKASPERFVHRIEVSGLYWHFVDLIWIILFPLLYLT